MSAVIRQCAERKASLVVARAVKKPNASDGGPRIRGGRRNAKCGAFFVAKMPLECHFVRTELVTTLKRKATEIIADLEQDHQPVLITQHGRPAASLVDVESFEALNQRIAVLEGIARAEQAIEQGRVVSHVEAKNRMGRWLNETGPSLL
jgi:prevent-host-death family protein